MPEHVLKNRIRSFIVSTNTSYAVPKKELLRASRILNDFANWLIIKGVENHRGVSDAMIDQYLEEQGAKGKTLGPVILEWQEYLLELPSSQQQQKKKKKKPAEKPPHFTSRELDLVLKQGLGDTHPERLMATVGILLMHDHLIRHGELRTIALKEIDCGAKTLLFRGETISLTDRTHQALLRYMEYGRPTLVTRLRWQRWKPEQYTLLFLGDRGRLMPREWPLNELKRRALSAGIKKEMNNVHFLRSAKIRQEMQ